MTSDAFEGPRDRSVRVGDKDRDAIGEILRKRHVEGRLDYDELQARLERAMAAKTYAELDELIADLPDAAARRRAQQVPTLGRPLLPFRFLPVAFLVLALALITAIAAGAGFAWLLIPLVVFFVVRPLIWRGWGGGHRHGLGAGSPRRMMRSWSPRAWSARRSRSWSRV